VYDLFFQNRKETLAPRIVARFTDCGKALPPAVGGYLLFYLGRRLLTAAVAVKRVSTGLAVTMMKFWSNGGI
jgi:hypothetical protein